ncbi:SdrD B-like domain-containing protein [Deinococcus puniceus]|uniref:DUF11 domain-containing protein n=1 Tax=Deinococcus puniceus TaxID=1182568 RepID=A0A172TCD4_9DEIO|nr:SdrD B-like domain-containing protein [Deinococcus puniceus]ANE44651.1 hypothetical protein SU48_13785 [Deinococcus puniceus]
MAAPSLGICTALGGTLATNLFENDGSFGSLSGTPANPTWAGALAPGRTTLKYIDNTIRTSPWAGSPEDGEYTVSNSSAFRSNFNNAWWYFTDHTGSTTGAPSNNLNGLMMVINASFTADIFYQQTLTVTPNTNYEYGLWIMNMLRVSGITPDIQIEVDRIVNGTALPTQVVAQTGDIAPSNPATWRPFGAVINSGPATQMTVKFRNNNPGGGGNDLAIDDLSFTGCTGLNIGSLSGTVFLDVDRNNTPNIPATDSALSGVTVQLVNATGAVTASAVTTSTGAYSFLNVPAATYTVRVQPSDPPISPTYVATSPAGAQRTGVVISNGAFIVNQDFGYQQGVDVQALKTQRVGSTGNFSSAALTAVPRTRFVQYQLTLSNAGSIPILAPSSLQDVLDSRFTSPSIVTAAAAAGGATGCAAAFGTGSTANTLTLTAATLPVGASCVVTVQVQATTAGALTNTATAFPPSGIPDYNTSNNRAQVATTVLNPPAVTLSKSARNLGLPTALNLAAPYGTVITGKPGDIVEYCLNYANAAGVLDAPNFVITDALPPNAVAWLVGYGGSNGLQWRATFAGVTTTTLLTSGSGDDAGDLNTSAVLRVGTLRSGGSGSLCFRTTIQ